MKRMIAIGLFVNAVLLVGILLREKNTVVHAEGGGGAPVVNGDVNGDGAIDISDAVYLLTSLYLGGPDPKAIECPSPAGMGLPATGQTKCYDTNGSEDRLVTDQLEAEWNARLRGLRESRDEYERAREVDHLAMDEEKKARIRALASDFPALWRNPKTPYRERKRMVRLLIEDVTLRKDDEISLNVRFKGGAVRSFLIPRLRASWEERRTPPEVVAQIDRLLDDHTEGEIAEILNEQGLVSGWGRSFDGRRVRVTRRLYKVRSRYTRLREAGFLKLEEAAKKLGICKWVVKERRAQGTLPVEVRKLNDMGEYMYKDPGGKDR